MIFKDQATFLFFLSRFVRKINRDSKNEIDIIFFFFFFCFLPLFRQISYSCGVKTNPPQKETECFFSVSFFFFFYSCACRSIKQRLLRPSFYIHDDLAETLVSFVRGTNFFYMMLLLLIYPLFHLCYRSFCQQQGMGSSSFWSRLCTDRKKKTNQTVIFKIPIPRNRRKTKEKKNFQSSRNYGFVLGARQ